MPGNAVMISCLAVNLACNSLSLDTSEKEQSVLLSQDLCDVLLEL